MKKIAVINDISGFGRCSLTAALPVISTLGVQCCPLVTGVFSAQTGYPSFFCTDLTDQMRPCVEKWKEMGESFDGILTGFISSAEQGAIILEMIREFRKEETLVVVDPVMADEGKIYPCYNDESIKIVGELVENADIITPNVSELCVLANEEFLPENIDEKTLIEKVKEYSEVVSKGNTIVLTTGLNLSENEIGIGVSERGNFSLIRTKKYGGSFSGTGDIHASIITAQAVKGVDLKQAAQQAADFISECAKTTLKDTKGIFDRNDGVFFERRLSLLTNL